MQTETVTKKSYSKQNSQWAFWIFPAIALMICVWIVYDHVRAIGPQIKISFEDAAGLQAGKTAVRFRGVDIGMVKQIEISDDTKEVLATVQLQADAKSFAQDGARFWIVTPQVSFQGVKGLETLIEGAYIAALPGKAEAEEKTDFKGATNSESTDPLENTSVFFLETSNAESINPGDSVTYRGLSVGSVTKVSLSKSAQVVVVQINLQNKYAKLIRSNTSFWRKSGIQANLGLFGSKVKINSLDSIIHGGVEFFTPTEAGPRAKYGARYNLSAEAPKGSEKWNPILD
jgi:paraquat-inducible protein B